MIRELGESTYITYCMRAGGRASLCAGVGVFSIRWCVASLKKILKLNKHWQKSKNNSRTNTAHLNMRKTIDDWKMQRKEHIYACETCMDYGTADLPNENKIGTIVETSPSHAFTHICIRFYNSNHTHCACAHTKRAPVYLLATSPPMGRPTQGPQ